MKNKTVTFKYEDIFMAFESLRILLHFKFEIESECMHKYGFQFRVVTKTSASFYHRVLSWQGRGKSGLRRIGNKL